MFLRQALLTTSPPKKKHGNYNNQHNPESATLTESLDVTLTTLWTFDQLDRLSASVAIAAEVLILGTVVARAEGIQLGATILTILGDIAQAHGLGRRSKRRDHQHQQGKRIHLLGHCSCLGVEPRKDRIRVNSIQRHYICLILSRW